MKVSISALRSCTIQTAEGEIAKVDDLLFDDATWVVRFLVVKTRPWLARRSVLLSPLSVEDVDLRANALRVSLTREQVESSPDVSTREPVSRKEEKRLLDYYGYPPYWLGLEPAGLGLYPAAASPAASAAAIAGETLDPEVRAVQDTLPDTEQGDPHLRSAREVIGYTVTGPDGELGHVEDILLDPQSFALDELIVDMRKWWPGKRVVVSAHEVRSIDFFQHGIDVEIGRDALESRPELEAGT
jgi:uncharacterized protein YrrD